VIEKKNIAARLYLSSAIKNTKLQLDKSKHVGLVVNLQLKAKCCRKQI